jgi:hypothetical protein
LFLRQAGELIGHADKLLGQLLEALVVGDQGLELGRLLGGHTFGGQRQLKVTGDDYQFPGGLG